MLSKSMMIGTVFEEEEVTSKKNFYNIAARDDRGKKFFHGSFTGGFSAGYKGTVGSKEGWAPSTFVSSRDQRHKGAKQSIQDYMDDEDLGGNIAGETITARAEYDTLGDTQREYLQKELGSSILGAAPSELMVSAKNSVGYEILRNMGGFKAKQAAQNAVVKKEPKKIYGVHMPSFKTAKPTEESTAFDFDEMTAEYSTQIPKANEQFNGLNYHQANFEEDEYEAVFNKIFKKHANLGQTAEEDDKEKEKAKQKNRMSMKAYGFEHEDEGDQFTNASGAGGSNKFVVEESDTIDEGLLRKAKMKKANRNALLEFEKDPAPYRVDVKTYKPEEIPKDWDPFKKVKEHFMKGTTFGGEAANEGRKWQDMNPQKRAELLGEDKDILEMKLQSISEEAKKRIAGVKKFVRGEEQTMGGDDLNLIFHGNKDKIERYKFFCWEKLGKLVSGIPPGNMTYEDLKKEKEEFETVYKIQTQPKMSDQVEEEEEVVQEKPMTEEERKQADLLKRIDELKKNMEKDKGKRKVEYWLPDRLLCRRFNVPQPKLRGDVETDQGRQQDKFAEEILPAFFGQKPVPKEVKAQAVQMVAEEDLPFKDFKSNKMERAQAFEQQQREAEEAEEEEEENVEENEPEPVVEERPPMELFESIFGDEDDETK